MSQVCLASDISAPEPENQPIAHDFQEVHLKANEARHSFKRTHTYQPQTTTRIISQIKSHSKKDSFEAEKQIDRSELASVRFNPIATVVKANGDRLGSSLRKAGLSAEQKVNQINI